MLVTEDRARQASALAALSSDELTGLLRSASNILERQAGRLFELKERTELHNGDGSRTLFVDNIPVSSVASITVVDSGNNSTVYNMFSDTFRMDSDIGEVQFRPDVSGTFTFGFQNVTVVYTAGFAAIPDDIQEAVIQIVIAMQDRGRTKTRERLEDYEAAFAQEGNASLPSKARSVISHYSDYARW